MSIAICVAALFCFSSAQAEVSLVHSYQLMLEGKLGKMAGQIKALQREQLIVDLDDDATSEDTRRIHSKIDKLKRKGRPFIAKLKYAKFLINARRTSKKQLIYEVRRLKKMLKEARTRNQRIPTLALRHDTLLEILSLSRQEPLFETDGE